MTHPHQPTHPYRPLAAGLGVIALLCVWVVTELLRLQASGDSRLALGGAPNDLLLTTLASLCGGLAITPTTATASAGELLMPAVVALMLPAVLQLSLVLLLLLVGATLTSSRALISRGGIAFLAGFLSCYVITGVLSAGGTPFTTTAHTLHHLGGLLLCVGGFLIVSQHGSPQEWPRLVWGGLGLTFATYSIGGFNLHSLSNSSVAIALDPVLLSTAFFLDLLLAAGALLIWLPLFAVPLSDRFIDLVHDTAPLLRPVIGSTLALVGLLLVLEPFLLQ